MRLIYDLNADPDRPGFMKARLRVYDDGPKVDVTGTFQASVTHTQLGMVSHELQKRWAAKVVQETRRLANGG